MRRERVFPRATGSQESFSYRGYKIDLVSELTGRVRVNRWVITDNGRWIGTDADWHDAKRRIDDHRENN